MTDISSKINTYESKLNYYRRYKKIIDKYNDDPKFKSMIENYITSNVSEQLIDTNEVLEIMIENNKLILQNLENSINEKKRLL
jgi:hypothetical protein